MMKTELWEIQRPKSTKPFNMLHCSMLGYHVCSSLKQNTSANLCSGLRLNGVAVTPFPSSAILDFSFCFLPMVLMVISS